MRVLGVEAYLPCLFYYYFFFMMMNQLELDSSSRGNYFQETRKQFRKKKLKNTKRIDVKGFLKMIQVLLLSHLL